MKLGQEGAIELGDTFVQHMDACLGCMACVTACPSGVQYDKLIAATRAQIDRKHTRSLGDRMFRRFIFALFPRHDRLRIGAVFAWTYQILGIGKLLRGSRILGLLPAPLQALESLLPRVRLRAAVFSRLPERTAAEGTMRGRVGLVSGCVQRVFFDDTNRATLRVLAAEGFEVHTPRAQGCCGALAAHAGVEESAVQAARRMITVFEELNVSVVVVNAAGCGSSLKDYGHLLGEDPVWARRAALFSDKVRDVHEFLDAVEQRAQRHPLPVRVAYHDACHLGHAQQIRAQPRRLLSSIPKLHLVEVAEPDICCGSAGIYNLVQPAAAADLGGRKASHIREADAALVTTANPGCAMQIRRHLGGDCPLHPIQLLDASIRGLSVDAVQQRLPSDRRGGFST